eukprot:9106748-Pyramimonas_sp.AAC.1
MQLRAQAAQPAPHEPSRGIGRAAAGKFPSRRRSVQLLQWRSSWSALRASLAPWRRRALATRLQGSSWARSPAP